jgi:serine/threonine protein kinase
MADPGVLRRKAEERIGTVLGGKYRLEALLGIGGMSAVYRAVHRNANRVAVKMLHDHVADRDGAKRRFLQEGYVANNVDHPGVVRVLDDDVTGDGTAFVVMELLEGETLAQQATRLGGVLPPEIVLRMAHELLDVLAASSTATSSPTTSSSRPAGRSSSSISASRR